LLCVVGVVRIIVLLSLLVGIEAILAKLGSIRAPDDVWDHLAAFTAFVSRAQQLTGFQNELVEGGDGVLRGGLERVSIITRLSFVLQQSDFLHELEQGRLRSRSFHHSFPRSLVIGELQAGITPLDFLSWWMVAFGNTPQPAFTTAGSTGHWLIRAAWGVLNRIILGTFAAVDALIGMGTE
jgi:hypothetical protein